MNVSDLTLEGFTRNVAGDGVAIRFGPFVSRIVTTLPELAAPIKSLYSDFPLATEGLVDFHVAIRTSFRWRHVFSPQAEFVVDGDVAFLPFDRPLALAFLEWGLNRCIYRNAHQFLIFHAAVVDRDGQALVFPGLPGSGKSTLCAALVNRGWRLLSDELTLVRPADGGLVSIARAVSLKDRSIQIIQEFAPDAVFGPRIENTHKGTMAHMRPPSDSVHRVDDLSKAAWIVFPRYGHEAETKLTPLAKARAFFRLADSSFNYDILGALGFRMTCDLVDSCDCYEFAYSSLDEAVARLGDL